MQKSHLFFNNPAEGVRSRKYKPRYFPKEEKNEQEKNYSPLKNSFSGSLRNYFSLKEQRDSRRNMELNIPLTIDFIKIDFFNYFEINPYENRYKNNYGLVPLKYFNFNKSCLFAVADNDKFKNFTDNIELFVSEINSPNLPNGFDKNILYIQSFEYYSSTNKILFDEPKDFYIIELIDSIDIYDDKIEEIEKSLLLYLKNKNVTFSIDYKTNKLELSNITFENLIEIIDNYDIVFTVNSPISGIVKPSPFGLEIKEYGFDISNFNDDLPIVGIIDTGISNLTPLAPLIINNGNEFDLTSTDPKIDNADHGTAVAAITSLGKNFYKSSIGAIEADCKLLSIKVLDSTRGNLSENQIIKNITDAHNKYGIKIFILCLGYEKALHNNSSVSNYAYSLDLLTYELDILIFIGTGNADKYYFDANDNVIDYPKQFDNSLFNIASPADSYNNIICGAISNNLENNSKGCYNIYDPSYPASYTRKFNLIIKNIPKQRLISKHLTKPDVCDCGGDFDLTIGDEKTGLKILSANPGTFYDRSLGTSYSTPFIANYAAQLLSVYPQLSNNMQTVKALIINSANIPNFGDLFDALSNVSSIDLIGKGIPNPEAIIYSNENQITFVLEDKIRPKFINSYPIKLPEYLLELDKERSLLVVSATLCFKFKPILYNHLAYCPISISFGIFKNIDLELSGEDEDGNSIEIGINGGATKNYQFKKSWSEDYFKKEKMLSNCQKISFVISKKDLINENNQFKIAIRSKLHGCLNSIDSSNYDVENNFSLAITIKENPVKGELSNRLYNEMLAINDLNAIAELEAEVELENVM